MKPRFVTARIALGPPAWLKNGSLALRVFRLPRSAYGSVNCVGQGVVEEQLAGVHDVSAAVHFHVDVNGPPGVPAGVDGHEGGLAVRIRDLGAAQESIG